jgi:hypothetical protein
MKKFDDIFQLSYDNFLFKTIIPLTKEEYLEKLKTDKDFSKEWKTKVIVRKATYKERYDYWFNNNYETGMERNYEIIPDFDNSYYDPTPTEIIEINYKNNKAISYI